MTAGFGAWFRRRILRAELRGSDIVTSTGVGVIRYSEWLEDARGWRRFWLLVSVLECGIFLGLPVLLGLGPTYRPDLDWGDPFRAGLIVAVSAVCLWCALIWQSSVRGMVGSLSAPRRATGEDED